MRVYIHFHNKTNRDVFEGYRLRKTLKGACECVDIKWVPSLRDKPEIAHFISPKDYKIARKCKAKGLKIIVSAFYCENDVAAAFFSFKRGREYLKRNSLPLFRLADHILVPNRYYLNYLDSLGFKDKVSVAPMAVNIDRFDLNEVEKRIFPRYFQVAEKTKYFIMVGNYSDKATLSLLKSLSLLLPDYSFYFFGSKTGLPLNTLSKEKLKKGTKGNVYFEGNVEDDIYRSALSNAAGYLYLDKHGFNLIGILDAFSAKIPIFGLKQSEENGLLLDKVNCHLAENVPDLAKLISSFYINIDKKTIITGYKNALEHPLSSLGDKLLRLYKSFSEETL